MKQMNRFLWLNGIFDEDSVKEFPAISPASNFWQRGFVDALMRMGNTVDVIGHPIERVWPFGRFFIHGKQASLWYGLKGTIVSYFNVPFLRSSFQYMNYLQAAKRYLSSSGKIPNYVVTYSCLSKSTDKVPSISTAKYICKNFGIPWICIVADGVAPPGADGYVYLTWSYYDTLSAPAPKVHIDGGVPVVRSKIDPSKVHNQSKQVKVLMYMGALTPHGGASQLANAFHLLSDNDIELWICGRGENTELIRLSEIDKRIKLFGFVSEHELDALADKAVAFVNPRPSDFEPNKLNYPSKLLHYLAYGKPVISTFTDGISPEYADILIPIDEKTEGGLSATIKNVLNMPVKDYQALCTCITNFNETHTWDYQIDRFISWLKNEI